MRRSTSATTARRQTQDQPGKGTYALYADAVFGATLGLCHLLCLATPGPMELHIFPVRLIQRTKEWSRSHQFDTIWYACSPLPSRVRGMAESRIVLHKDVPTPPQEDEMAPYQSFVLKPALYSLRLSLVSKWSSSACHLLQLRRCS